MTRFPITTHLIRSTLALPIGENREDPRRVFPTQVYGTMCGRYLPGQGHPFRCSFDFPDVDCEECLDAAALQMLAKVP